VLSGEANVLDSVGAIADFHNDGRGIAIVWVKAGEGVWRN
jgi:hypothetical protein